MGNQKYPLNGKALTLEDLVSEYAFNAEIRYNDDYIKNEEHTTIITGLLLDLCVNTSLYNLYEQNVDGSTFNDLNTYKLNVSTFQLDSSKLLNLYNSFETNIIDEDNKDKANKTYELCYFPTVYSKEKRTSDNKKYKIIQAGDDELFAPDKYIKFKDIITVGNAMRPIQLFHYTYDNLAFDVNKSEYDNRYSFNYKRNDGEAVISYAIRQLYALDSSDNSSLLGLSKELNCIDFDTFEKNEITSTTNVNGISTSIDLSQFKDTSLNDLFDFILFGKIKDKDTNIDKFYILFTPGKENENHEIPIGELYFPLLYDLKDCYHKIIDSNHELTIFAYKYLCNVEYRNFNARYVISTENNNDYSIITFKTVNDNDNNTQYNTYNGIRVSTFNDFLKKYIFNESTQTIFDTSFMPEYKDAFNNSYYDVYDEVTNQVKESDIQKRYNLYWKILYYCQLITGSQLYYTGIILDAVYDVINEQHLYTNESPIYRCDIGANSNIQTVWVRNIVECLYGLPPTNLEEYNAIININIPITIKTLISETNTIYNKRWNMQQIKTLLQSGLNANTEYNVNTGVIEPDPNIPYEYMVIYDVNNEPLNINTLEDINNMLSATMSTYVMDIKNKDPRVSELNQTLTIWDSKTNPSYNTTNGQFNNYGDNPLTFLRGTIFAHINYSGDHFINIEFPVMRLQNYYTESVINQKRVVNLYFVKPISVSDIEDEHTYNVNISYNFTDNSDTLKSSILINNLNDVNVWLYSYSGSATFYVYGKNGIDGIFSEAGKAVIYAYENAGVIVDDEGEYIWRRSARNTRNQIMAITGEEVSDNRSSLAVCLDTILKFEGVSRRTEYLLEQGNSVTSILEASLKDVQVLNLKGCSLDAILYYVNMDIPVLATLQDGNAVLIVGFNELNIVVMDPLTGTVYKKGMNDSTQWLEENGNNFITYIRKKQDQGWQFRSYIVERKQGCSIIIYRHCIMRALKYLFWVHFPV